MIPMDKSKVYVLSVSICCAIVLCAAQSGRNDVEHKPDDRHINVTWCTVGKEEQRKCINFARAIDRDRMRVGYDEFKMFCYQAFNKDECMQQLDAEKVTFTSLDSGEVFVGGRFHSLVPIAQEVAEGGFNFNYAVAVVKKETLQDVHSLRDLRGKRGCFAGVGTLAGWTIPVYTMMKEGGMEIIDCNNHVKSATNFFGPSCAVNALTDKYNPIGDNSDKLCSLCIGKIPGGKCTDSDPYAGFEGAFRCLLEVGDIAFLKHYTVEELTGGVEFSAVSKDGFELFCKDGTRRPIDDYRSCNWGTVPSNAIVTSSASSLELRRKYQKFLDKVAKFYSPRRNDTFQGDNRNEDNPQFDQFGNRIRQKRQNFDQYSRSNQGRNPNYDNRNNQDQNRFNQDGNNQNYGRDDNNQNYGRDDNRGGNRDDNRDGNRDYNRDDNRDRNLDDNRDRNRDDNRDRNRDDNRDRDSNPYSRDPFARDPYSINRGQYGINIDPYEKEPKTYNRDQEDAFDDKYDDDYYHRYNGSFYETFNLFESAPKYGIHNNLLVQDITRKFASLDENLQTYSGYLGNSLDVIMGIRDCPVNRMTLCVTSDVELEKCVKMRTALKAQLLKPEMVCYKGHSQIHCMQAIRSGSADITVLDASDVYTAGLSFDLVPFISEVYNLGKPEYYVVAVAKESDPDTEITYLKGKNTCHGGINTAAGWVYPLAYLLSNGWIRPYGCNSIRAAAEYFSKSCVPGAISTEYNTGVPYDNMCHLCHGASYRYCRRDASEDYYGHTGAFRCLVEGGGHVAFVKHTTVIENTGGKRKEWWARDALMDDFELLCPDGTRAEVNEYDKCNLGKVKSNAIVARGGYAYNHTQISAYINLFMYSQTFYGRKIPDEFSFSMFYSTPPYTDLIFQDATTQLLVIPPEQRYYSDYLGKDFMRARRIVDCHAGAASLHKSVLILTISSMFSLIILKNYNV